MERPHIALRAAASPPATAQDALRVPSTAAVAFPKAVTAAKPPMIMARG
jgi:hypothetical protein